MQQQKVESPHELARRLAKNTWTRCVGLSIKSQLLLRLKVKEHEVKERKKAFGVHYMDLMGSGASQQDLTRCVEGTKTQLESMFSAMAEIKAEIAQIDSDIQAKLIEDPSSVPSENYHVVTKTMSSSASTDDEWDVVDGEDGGESKSTLES